MGQSRVTQLFYSELILRSRTPLKAWWMLQPRSSEKKNIQRHAQFHLSFLKVFKCLTKWLDGCVLGWGWTQLKPFLLPLPLGVVPGSGFPSLPPKDSCNRGKDKLYYWHEGREMVTAPDPSVGEGAEDLTSQHWSSKLASQWVPGLHMPLAFSRSSGWAGRQTARHWISWLLTAALELRLGWGWQGVGDEAGCLWCAYRTAAALGSLPAHPWLVGPCSAPGSLIGRHSLGKGQTGTGTDNQSGVSGDQEKGPLISLYKYHTVSLCLGQLSTFAFSPPTFFSSSLYSPSSHSSLASRSLLKLFLLILSAAPCSSISPVDSNCQSLAFHYIWP